MNGFMKSKEKNYYELIGLIEHIGDAKKGHYMGNL